MRSRTKAIIASIALALVAGVGGWAAAPEDVNGVLAGHIAVD
ncbi:hypothetical protein [Herbidospora mongoliensis]|nr:hypothetical protein [Herbidospora mongoliensis]